MTDGRGLRCLVNLGPKMASFSDVIDGWRGDADFRSLFNDSLASSPFDAFRWETPPLTATTASRPFEFVLLDSPGVGRRPDPDAFSEHFRADPVAEVVAFPNLGRDAILIVPLPLDRASSYGHLGAFVRGAPEAQRHALWKSLGEAASARIASRPVWISTAGAGVSWLHVRLDDRPKYYGFVPYKLHP